MKKNDFVLAKDNNHGNPVEVRVKINRISTASEWVEVEYSNGRRSVFHKRCLRPLQNPLA